MFGIECVVTIVKSTVDVGTLILNACYDEVNYGFVDGVFV